MGRSKRNKHNKKELTEKEIERIKERNLRRQIAQNKKQQRRNEKRGTNKIKNIMEEKLLLAVYDNFLKKCNKNNVFDNSQYIGTFESIPVFSLYDIGGSEPVLTTAGSTSVKFEVYEITKAVMDKVNNLQSCYPDNPTASFLEIESISTPFGEASVHVFLDDMSAYYNDATLISSGDWLDYKMTHKQTNLKLN